MKESNIPSEIKSFFESSSGQTLLIKGKPGTGKTIFAFEVLKEVCDERNGLYFSTRVTPEKLYAFFPWIRNIIPEKNIVNATPNRMMKVFGSDFEAFKRPFDFDSALAFFKMLYEDAEEMDNPVVVIDSWDVVLNYVNLKDQGATLTQSLCELCREVGTHLILVSETADQTPLDFIVDGVVKLSDVEIRGEAMGGQVYSEQLSSRTARLIELNKLRGVKRGQKSYVFTLHNGRFRSFPPYTVQTTPRLEPIPDIDKNHRSTGIKDLDNIIGGLKRGGLTLFEIEYGVGLRYIPFLDQIAMNLSSNNIGVVRIRSAGVSSTLENKIPEAMGVYQFKPKTWITWRLEKLFPTSREYLDFFEVIKKESSEILELSLMESRKEYAEFLEQKGESHPSVAEFIGLDTFEILYGADNTLKLLDEAVSRAIESNEVLIAVVKRGVKSVEMITKIADAHIIFKDIVGSLFIYGVQPRTGLYNVSSDEQGIHLTPVV